MAVPDGEEIVGVARTNAAPQRSAAAPHPPGPGAALPRARGPHPLPVFLDIVTRVCGTDRARLGRVLAGLRRYQAAPPAPVRVPQPEIARSGNVSLRDHGGSGPPVIVVPSLINPPTVLDLAPGNSLLAGLAARGLNPLLVDWGAPEDRDLAALVAGRLVPLIAGLGTPVALAGYCLGGTLALGAATLLGPSITRLALLATPWDFAGYGPAAPGFAQWWQGAEPLAARLGAVPMDLLQPAFWTLDPDSLADKFARFGALAPDDSAGIAGFVALEDWSNSGPPLALATARDLAEGLFTGNASGTGNWLIAGQRVDPGVLAAPILDIIATRDRIVPPAAALTARHPAAATALPLAAGHVGMVVGGRAPQLLWDPLAAWLRG